MADECDRAQLHIERDLENAIAAARGIQPATYSALECHECGDTIPQARRDAIPGVQTCVECAQVLEARRLRGWL